ncbi:MAG TPA: class I SAM-dependent methyltransferase [Candidatus Binataceae bacterium]|nr:class I SAM-dependent methyltransferase [Candidatus Binataceae bacterium]
MAAMIEAERIKWERRHQGQPPGDPEPFLIDSLDLMPRGLALDVAAGRGRNSIAMARTGMHVVAADFSSTAISALAEIARTEHLPIWPVIADFDNFALRDSTFDAIVNINFLDRALFPPFKRALRPGGVLVVETFLVDQASSWHISNKRFLLDHYELRELVSGLELIRYREGLFPFLDGTSAWRAGAVARKV